MAVVFDQPTRTRVRGRDIFHAHLMSDQHGIAGSRELLEVAKALGLPRAWLQHADKPHEHFDLWGADTIDRARRCYLAREVNAIEIVRICRAKFRAVLIAAVEHAPAAIPMEIR